MGGLLSLDCMLLDTLLDKGVAVISSLRLIAVDVICNKDIYVSALVSCHFHGFFLNGMHASACPVL